MALVSRFLGNYLRRDRRRVESCRRLQVSRRQCANDEQQIPHTSRTVRDRVRDDMVGDGAGEDAGMMAAHWSAAGLLDDMVEGRKIAVPWVPLLSPGRGG